MSVIVGENGTILLHYPIKTSHDLILTFSEIPLTWPSTISLPPSMATMNGITISGNYTSGPTGVYNEIIYTFTIVSGTGTIPNYVSSVLNTVYDYLSFSTGGITFASSNSLSSFILTTRVSNKTDGLVGQMSYSGPVDPNSAFFIILDLTTGSDLDMSIDYADVVTSSEGVVLAVINLSPTLYYIGYKTPIIATSAFAIFNIPSNGLLSLTGDVNANPITFNLPLPYYIPPTFTPTSIDSFNYSHIICYLNNGNKYQSIHSAIYNEHFSIRNNLLYILSQYLVNTELKTYILPSLNQSYLFYDPINDLIPGVQSLINFMITTPLLESDVPKFISDIKKMYPMLSKFVKSYYDPRFNTESCDEKTNKWMNSFTYLHCDLKLILNN